MSTQWWSSLHRKLCKLSTVERRVITSKPIAHCAAARVRQHCEQSARVRDSGYHIRWLRYLLSLNINAGTCWSEPGGWGKAAIGPADPSNERDKSEAKHCKPTVRTIALTPGWRQPPDPRLQEWRCKTGQMPAAIWLSSMPPAWTAAGRLRRSMVKIWRSHALGQQAPRSTECGGTRSTKMERA